MRNESTRASIIRITNQFNDGLTFMRSVNHLDEYEMILHLTSMLAAHMQMQALIASILNEINEILGDDK